MVLSILTLSAIVPRGEKSPQKIFISRANSYVGSSADPGSFEKTTHLQGNAVYSAEFARRHADQGIVCTSLHPGLITTDIQRTAQFGRGFVVRSLLALLDDFLFEFQAKLLNYRPPMGAITPLWAGTSPEALNYNGEVRALFFPSTKINNIVSF